MKFAELWNTIPGLSVTAIPGSTSQNSRDFAQNRLQVGLTNGETQNGVFYGVGGYPKYEGLRYMLPWKLANIVWVTRADNNISSLADLKNKHIMPGAEGTFLKKIGLATLEAVGITPENIRQTGGQMSHGSVGNSVTMLQDKQLDAMVIMVPREGVYTPILPIENIVGIKYIRMDEKIIEYVLKKMPILRRGSVAGGLYKNEPKDYDTIGEGYAYSCRSDLPEELVYRMVSLVWKNGKEIAKINPHFYT